MLGIVQMQAPCPRGPAVQTEREEKKQGMLSPQLSTRGSAAQGSGSIQILLESVEAFQFAGIGAQAWP